jgi:hypothetical protein
LKDVYSSDADLKKSREDMDVSPPPSQQEEEEEEEVEDKKSRKILLYQILII